MKSLFYCGLFNEFHVDFLEKIIDDNGDLEEIIVISDDFELKKNHKIKIQYVKYETIKKILLKNDRIVDYNIFDLKSEELFNSLKMMDRLHPIDSFGFESRMKIFFNLIHFWNKIFKKKKIDIAIFHNRPHEVFDYVAQLVLSLKRVDTYYFFQTNFMGFYEVVKLPSKRIKNNHYNIDIENLFLDTIKNYRDQNFKPFYLTPPLKFNLILKKFDGFLSTLKFRGIKSFLTIMISALRSKFKNFINEKYLKKISIKPNLNENFIFIPLQFQPELTTCPSGGLHVYQEILINQIHSILPENWKLYIKEHPNQNLSVNRSLDFYKKIKLLKNVVFINKKYDSYQLLNKCRILVTSTGTLGLEALLKAKPIIITGDVFFNDAPNAIKLNPDINLISHIQKVEKNVKETHIEKYMKEKFKFLFYGYSDPLYAKQVEIDYKLNIENMSKIFSNLTK